MVTSTPVLEPVVAIVVAAGSGTRLGAGVPKALRPVGGIPLVTRSVLQLAAGGCTHALVVIAPELSSEFEAALASSPIPVVLIAGGALRQDSVRHGLEAIDAEPALSASSIVLIHDAARAFVPAEVVARVIDAVRGGSVAVIPVIEVTDSIRELNQVGSAVVDRAQLRAVQTPQAFDRETIMEAHRLVHEHSAEVTDDAAVVEFAGATVSLVEGSRVAFKVTEPFDLLVAQALVAEA